MLQVSHGTWLRYPPPAQAWMIDVRVGRGDFIGKVLPFKYKGGVLNIVVQRSIVLAARSVF